MALVAASYPYGIYPARRPRPVAYGWEPVDLASPEFAGLGRFFKRVAQTVSKVAHAPLRAIAPSLGRKMEALDHKIIDKVDDLHTSINGFFRRNWKWVVIAAAVALTIYTMGSGASLAAKMASGLVKLKTLALTAGSKVLTWKAAIVQVGTAAMQKLMGGARYGDLSAQEVDALGNVNAATGEQVVPPEVLGVMAKGPGASGLATGPTQEAASLGDRVEAQASAQEPTSSSLNQASALATAAALAPPVPRTSGRAPGPKNLPPWAIPAAVGAGALLLILVLRR